MGFRVCGFRRGGANGGSSGLAGLTIRRTEEICMKISLEMRCSVRGRGGKKEREKEKGTYDPEADPRPDVNGVRTEGVYDLGRGGGEPRPVDCSSEKDTYA